MPSIFQIKELLNHSSHFFRVKSENYLSYRCYCCAGDRKEFFSTAYFTFQVWLPVAEYQADSNAHKQFYACLKIIAVAATNIFLQSAFAIIQSGLMKANILS